MSTEEGPGLAKRPWWLLAVVGGTCGYAVPFAPAYLHYRLRTPRYLYATVCWSIVLSGQILTNFLSPRDGAGDLDTSNRMSSLSSMLLVVCWLGGLIYTLVEVGRAPVGPRTRVLPRVGAPPTEPVGPYAQPLTAAQPFPVPAFETAEPEPVPAPPPRTAPTRSGPRRIDLNFASAAELEKVLGEKATSLVLEMRKLQPFRRVDELALRGVVPPHVYRSVEPQLTVSNPGVSDGSDGRPVDF